jgi:hypothetical protein
MLKVPELPSRSSEKSLSGAERRKGIVYMQIRDQILGDRIAASKMSTLLNSKNDNGLRGKNALWAYNKT